MQSKKTIIIVLVVVALIGILGYFAFTTSVGVNTQTTPGIPNTASGGHISTQAPQTGDSSNSNFTAPQFIPDPNRLVDSTKKLSFDERGRLSTFIGNTAGLLQTYGYDEYNTISGLSDYFTTKGRISLQNYLALLQQNTKPGYRQYAVADSTAQIHLYYNQATKLYSASVYTIIYNLSNLKDAKPSGHQIIDFELIKDGSAWKFNSVSLYIE